MCSSDLTLVERALRVPARVTGRVGAPLRIPYPGTSTTAVRSEMSLLEIADNRFLRDRFDAITLAQGYVELSNLEAGDYELHFHTTDQSVAIVVTAGELRDRWAIGATRWVTSAGSGSPQIRSVEAANESVAIQLGEVSKDARLHVWATRYLPSYAPQRLEVPMEIGRAHV